MARATSTETVKRPRKSAAEKAQADLDKATKAHEKAVERREKLVTQIDAARAEVVETERYLDYVSRNPALPAQDAGEPQPEEG